VKRALATRPAAPDRPEVRGLVRSILTWRHRVVARIAGGAQKKRDGGGADVERLHALPGERLLDRLQESPERTPEIRAHRAADELAEKRRAHGVAVLPDAADAPILLNEVRAEVLLVLTEPGVGDVLCRRAAEPERCHADARRDARLDRGATLRMPALGVAKDSTHEEVWQHGDEGAALHPRVEVHGFGGGRLLRRRAHRTVAAGRVRLGLDPRAHGTLDPPRR